MSSQVAHTSLLLAALAAALLLFSSASAGETWDGNGGDNDWTTNNNWDPNGEPPNDGTANIVMAGTNRLTPRVDVDWDVRSLVFSNTAGGFAISGGSGVSLGVGEGGIVNQDTQPQLILLPIDLNASQTWSASQGQLSVGNTIAGHFLFPRTLTLSGANLLQISGAITNQVSLTKTGSGTLTFNGLATNTYTGTTTVSAGTLILDRSGGSNRAIPDDLIIGDGSGSDIVRLDSSDQISEAAGNTVTVNSSGLLNLNGFNETLQNLTLNGGTVSGAGTLTLNGSISTAASTSSVISSAVSAATLTNAGTLTLSGTDSNSIGTTTINSGTILLNKSGGSVALGNTIIGDGVGSDIVRLLVPEQISIGGSVTINTSGLLDLNGFNQSLSAINLYGGNITTGSGSLTVHGTLHSFPSAQTAGFSGKLGFSNSTYFEVEDGTPVDDLVFDGSVYDIRKRGSGQMRLIGNGNALSFLTDAEVFSGTLVLARAPADTVSGVGVRSGASLVLAADEQILGSVQLIGGTWDLAGFNETISGLSLWPGSALETSGGTLVMNSLSLYGANLNPTSDLITVNGAVHASVQQAGATVSLIGGNVNLAAANKVVDVGSNASLEIALSLSGTSLTMKGGGPFGGTGGTLLMSGPANTYTGATNVYENVLMLLGKAAIDGAIPADLIVAGATVRSAANEQIATSGLITLNPGGVLDLNGFTETIGSLALNGGTVTMGTGTLVVTGSISQSASAESTISGRLDLSGAARIITSEDTAAAIDLNIPAQIINGGIVKQGAGTLRLGGNNTFAGGVNQQAGKLLIAHDSALGTGTLTLQAGTTVEADGAARNISTPVVVANLSTVSGSNALTFSGSFTTNPGAVLFKSGSGTLTIAGPQIHGSSAVLLVTAGTVNFNSSAAGATLGINFSNAGTVVNFNAAQVLNALAVNGGRAKVADTTLLDASSLSIDTDAVLELEIGGPAAGEFAQVDVSGNAALAGTLEITLINDFSPIAGNSFDILDWGTLSGTFSSITLPALTGGKTWNTSQLYTTGVLSVVGAHPGDFDSDGDVDGADFVAWQTHFPTATGAMLADGDADGDGDVDGADFVVWQTNFPFTPVPGAAPVPEPSAWMLALVASLGSLSWLHVRGLKNRV